MKRYNLLVTLLFLGATMFFSCNRNNQNNTGEKPPQLPAQPYAYNMRGNIPSHLNGFGNITNEGATLGRVLFFDKQLSYNNQVSCASCHSPEKAFGDDVAFSKGLNGDLTTRNAMTLTNLDNSGSFFWDSRTFSLEEAVLMPVQNHIEMGFENLNILETKLNKIEYYQRLFKNIFNVNRITRNEVASALAQFVRSINSANSKLDQEMEQGFPNLTAQENTGKNIFEKNCATCHTGITFPDFTSNGYESPGGSGFANNGLDDIYKDKGVEQSRLKISDGEGFFKIPNLRNIELTAPYMHDGRFKTLEAVLEHYSTGIIWNKDLDPNLRDPRNGSMAKKMNFSQADKDALLAFLKTMTDRTILTDVRFSDPFKY